MKADEIDEQYKNFDTRTWRAFAPAIVAFIALMGFNVILAMMSAVAGVVFDDIHFLPVFLPQFFTFVALGLIGLFKSFKINDEKTKFKKANSKHFAMKEIEGIESDIKYLSELKEKIGKGEVAAA